MNTLDYWIFCLFAGNKLEEYKIGFSASMGIQDVIPLPSNLATIKFPITSYNRGGHFNNITSHFRCPDHGTYIFTATLYCEWNSWVDFSIVVEGVRRTLCASGDDDGLSSGTAIAIIDCIPGQNVWVRNEKKRFSYSKVYSLFSQFTGFRIW